MTVRENIQFDENNICRKCGQSYGVHCGNDCPTDNAEEVSLRTRITELEQQLAYAKGTISRQADTIQHYQDTHRLIDGVAKELEDKLGYAEAEVTRLKGENEALVKDRDEWKKLSCDQHGSGMVMGTKLHDAESARDAALAERDRLRGNRPKIVCLCGSTRFTAEMMAISWGLTKDGIVVLGWEVRPTAPGEPTHHLAEAEGLQAVFDEVHKRKIDLCDYVLVLNIGGYIGESTRSEIDYAIAHGKPVTYLEALEAKTVYVAAHDSAQHDKNEVRRLGGYICHDPKDTDFIPDNEVIQHALEAQP